MGGLSAAVYKDLKLFLRGGGLAALLLPLLLVPALRFGMGDLSVQAYVQPFPIAVRDLDNTIMSRSLISQMAQIQLFSRVDAVDESETDQQALDRGAAAVVTVPKDFFYHLYSMEDCPVDVALNGDMPLESTLFQAIFRSVMDIIRADQSAALGTYRFCYGDLTGQQASQLYAQASQQLLQDALGRQSVFDTQAEPSDLQGALERRLLACVLGLLTLFFSLSAVKTLPEELELGVLPRFQAAGGSLGAFLVSKYLAALLLTLPSLILAGAVFYSGSPVPLLFLAFLLSLGAFGLMLALAAWTGSAAGAQRWGNLLVLLSLVLGGTLWPRHLLPGPLPMLGRLTLPYYAALGLEAASRGAGLPQLAAVLWPVPVMGAAGIALAVPLLRRRRDRHSSAGTSALSAAPDAPAAFLPTGLFRRTAGLAQIKLKAMSGGWAGLAVMTAAALLCGLSAACAQQGGAAELRLAVCDLDGSALSQELTGRLESRGGLSVTLCTPEEGSRLLLLGETEGLLTIGSGYEQALGAGEQTPLHYEGASSSVSAQGVREIVAGQVAVQRSRLRAPDMARELLGRPLSEAEISLLSEEISAAEAAMPALFQISGSGGALAAEPFSPSQLSFAALAALLSLFTAAPWCGSAEGRQAERRMASLPRGRLLSYGSDCLAVGALALVVTLAALLPGSGLDGWTLIAAAAYALCGAALALALVRFTAQEGRVDALAPFLALILCLLGGCFLDLSQLSPTAARLALLTPPGLAVRAAQGSPAAAAALLLAGAALLRLGMPRRRA